MRLHHDSLVEACDAARSAVEVAGAGATDSGMVQRIRASVACHATGALGAHSFGGVRAGGAAQGLRDEIRGMDMRIAFVQHELEHARLRAQGSDDSILDFEEVS